MSRSFLRALPLGVVASVAVIFPAAAGAATYTVCEAGPPACDFALVSDAVSDPATVDGDRIEVAAGTYVEEQGVTVTKALEIAGAGSGQTIIDGGGGEAAGQTGQLEIQTGSGEDVSVSGLTVREPVSDPDADGLRTAIFAKSTANPGPSYTFTDVAIEGVGGAAAGEEYGLYTFNSTANTVFDDGSISGTAFNPVLIDHPVGPTTISNSEIARGTECCGVFSMTEIAGGSANAPQVFTGNHLTGGAGVTYFAALVPTAGGFADVEVSDNVFESITSGSAISLTNGGSGDGTAAEITGPVVTGNVVEGAGGGRGVTLTGLVSGAQISGNDLENLAVGVRVTGGGHAPTGTVIGANRIVGNGIGVENTTPNPVNAEQNWWGCNEGPGAPDCDSTSGSVDADPWLVLSLSGPAALGAGDTAPYLASVGTTSSGGPASAPELFPAAEVGFAATNGSIDTPKTLASSAASSDFTAPFFNGPVDVSATLDNETVTQTVEVSGAPIAPTALDARPMLLDDDPFSIPLGRFTAFLTNADTGEPIAGKEIVFSKGAKEYCRATTDASGRASCTIPLLDGLAAVLGLTYRAEFAGDPNTAGATDTGKLLRLLKLIELF